MAKQISQGAGILGTLLALFSNPITGLALLIVGGVLLIVLLGVFVWVYLTLQSLHLVTAIVFGVIALFMFYIGTRSGAINAEFLHHYPWIPLLIPAAFLFGYLADITQNIKFMVAPFALSSAQQGTVNAIVVFLIVVCLLYVVSEHLESKPAGRRRK
jgi:hypothetical protein